MKEVAKSLLWVALFWVSIAVLLRCSAEVQSAIPRSQLRHTV
jgi:hypothetical protein